MGTDYYAVQFLGVRLKDVSSIFDHETEVTRYNEITGVPYQKKIVTSRLKIGTHTLELGCSDGYIIVDWSSVQEFEQETVLEIVSSVVHDECNHFIQFGLLGTEVNRTDMSGLGFVALTKKDKDQAEFRCRNLLLGIGLDLIPTWYTILIAR